MEFFKFIMINNQLLDENSEFHLTSNELYIYSLLSSSRNIRGQIYTTPSTIHAIGHIKLATEQKRAIKAIKDTLISLRDKKVINFTNADGEITDAFKANDTLIVELSEFDTEYHTQLNFEVLDGINNIRHLHVYLAVFKWNNSESGVFVCSQERWSKILQCSKRHAVNLVNRAEGAGIIYKNIGDYNEKGKQDVNQYRTTPFEDDEITHHSFKKKYVEIEEETDLEHFTVEHLKEAEQRFITFKDENGKDVFPNEKDYVLMRDLYKKGEEFGLTEFEQKIFNAGKKRIGILRKNDATAKISDELNGQAKIFIKHRDEMEMRN